MYIPQPVDFRSQWASTIAAAVLLVSGLSTFLFTTTTAAHQRSTPSSGSALPLLTSSHKPSPLVPMSHEALRRLARATQREKKVAESSITAETPPEPLP